MTFAGDAAMIERLNLQLISANARLETAASKIRDLERQVDELMCWTVGAYVDGELDGERGEAFRRHLQKCKVCQDETAVLLVFASRLRRSGVLQ